MINTDTPPVQSPQMLLRLILLAVALSAMPASAQEPPLAYHCAQDGDIDVMKRAVVEGVATNFVRSIIASDPGSAWDTMTPHGQQSVSRDQFVANAMLSIVPAQPRNMAVRHVFMIHVVGTPPPGARATCGADPSDPLQSFKMVVAPVIEQAYTLISADGSNNGLVFTLWLVRDGEEWKVNSFASNVSTLAGQDAVQLWRLAHEQHAKGHEFNATLLYFAAAQIAQRGPDFELGVTGPITSEQATVTRPKEISGTPPFTFVQKGRSFNVVNIGATAAGMTLFLAVTQEVPPWKNQNQVERWNRELIFLLLKHFPEWREVFPAIVVQASEQGTGRTFVTVDDQTAR
jgi:hypothetical protein